MTQAFFNNFSIQLHYLTNLHKMQLNAISAQESILSPILWIQVCFAAAVHLENRMVLLTLQIIDSQVTVFNSFNIQEKHKGNIQNWKQCVLDCLFCRPNILDWKFNKKFKPNFSGKFFNDTLTT